MKSFEARRASHPAKIQAEKSASTVEASMLCFTTCFTTRFFADAVQRSRRTLQVFADVPSENILFCRCTARQQ